MWPITAIDFVIKPAANPSPFVLVEIDLGFPSECWRGGDHLITNPIAPSMISGALAVTLCKMKLENAQCFHSRQCLNVK